MSEDAHGAGKEDDGPNREDEDARQAEEDTEDDSIRESVFEGDDSSEYIRGAILKASESEREAMAEETEGPSRLQMWLVRNLPGKDGRLESILYNANPRNYDRLDWIFAFSFVVVLAGVAVMFTTTSITVAIVTFVVMFIAFVSMLLCVGVEDILKDGFHKVRGDE
ncbi:MAG: hypothetical protein U5J64_01365 [Halobacteriales archaeon]|nr:hypothetical protein [Halobacteriales archaeon]